MTDGGWLKGSFLQALLPPTTTTLKAVRNLLSWHGAGHLVGNHPLQDLMAGLIIDLETETDGRMDGVNSALTAKTTAVMRGYLEERGKQICAQSAFLMPEWVFLLPLSVRSVGIRNTHLGIGHDFGMYNRSPFQILNSQQRRRARLGNKTRPLEAM